MKKKIMITPDQIDQIESFNLDVLKEAMRQVELLINSEDIRKERIDRRVYTLLPFLVGMITLTFTAQNIKFFNEIITIALGITGLLLFIPVVLLLKILQPKIYGSLGTFPCVWLYKDLIENQNDTSNQDALGWVLTHYLYQVNDSILTSDQSNKSRLTLLNKAVNFSIGAVMPMVGAIAISLFQSVVSVFF